MQENRKAIAILFVSIFLVMVGNGVIIPLLPFIVLRFNGTSTSLGFLIATYPLMQFLFAPLWGRLSDRIGRRPVLLIGLSGYGMTYILFGLSSSLWMMFVARLLSGMIASATLPTAYAYIADITSNENRAKGMGMIAAAIGLGMIFGPALGGWLGDYGFSLPFFAAGGMALLTLPFAYLFLTESLQEPNLHAPIVRPNISLKVFHNPLFPIFTLSFMANFAMSLFESTFALFAADRVGFGPRETGLLFAGLGVIGVIIQLGVLGKLVNLIGDIKVITTGIIISIVGFGLMISSPNKFLLIIFTNLFIVGYSLLRPSFPSLITKLSTGRQGKSVGLLQSFNSLSRVFGPVIGGLTYGININLPYALSATVLILILLLYKDHLQKYHHKLKA